ncbi:selenide, water dikinase SelD [Natronospirillum operosum]|uniref:Selenide, water dikinase SelD n=1 Tax=Natronospirillum operosum TaxID=2759953 RepID=A0A4Z0W8F0_9GAMM|nr:selenide, water dikinase SelD [Natronospirillum operosum]TGG90241.1 selenide, water dikinase SelD [Natronospirillum operosum]
MKATPPESERELVLVGGGHTHALLIRRLGMRPLPGVRVTLISESAMTPYSGMLPGLIAGHYTFDETHIDLNRLCQRCGVRFVEGRLTGFDPQARRLQIRGRPELRYDLVSFDTGSTPNLSIPGAREHAVGVKPVSHFHDAWSRLLAQLEQTPTQPLHWGVVGAGAGGVELVLAMVHRLRGRSGLNLHLIFSSERVLPGYPTGVVRAAERALQTAGVTLHAGAQVTAVTADGVTLETGHTIALHRTVLCTPASAPDWPARAGLDTANDGFIAVNQYLQSTSHATVFAAGDVAEMVDDPRPKAGVYAVRQAPTLQHNIERWFRQQPLEPIRLQRRFLSLLSLGDRRATGSRNGLSFTGYWVWRWKDRIDRRFMDALNNFRPGMAQNSDASETPAPMHCAGCGSKLGPELLQDTLADLPQVQKEAVLPALGKAEDASLWTPTPGRQIAQSVDGFRAFSDDLYRLGQVAVHHALSDLYAMNATPVSAQVWINLAFGHARVQAGDFRQVMRGIAEALVANDCVLAGGHSTEGLETHLSVTASGEVAPDRIWRKSGARSGDWLVLSKPLGTGVILAADMTGDAPAGSMTAAWDSMLNSNREAWLALQQLQPNAVTDVTGFGLLGHLLEMLEGSELSAELQAEAIPALPGALDLLAAGRQSSLVPHLLPQLNHCHSEAGVNPALTQLLLDPQTSGGLLAAVPDISALPATFAVIGRLDQRSEASAVRVL